MRFAKGHGTENDFVILPDPDDAIDLTPGLAARLCDRHAGLGADGVLRAVRIPRAPGGPAAVPGDPGRPAARPGDGAEWFMDYRNADGSLAEMCGNGIRVFCRYLLDHHLAAGPEFAVATRVGTRLVRAEPDGEITVDMGPPRVLGAGRATLAGRPLEGLRMSLGNPHLACLVDSPLAEFDLSQPPVLDAGEFPDGVNLELVSVVGNGHILMRVYERGSGATRSCGTGAVAAAAAAMVAAANGSTSAVSAHGASAASAKDDASAASAKDDASAASAKDGASAASANAGASAAPARDGLSISAQDGPSAAAPKDRMSSGPAADAAVLPPGGWVVDLPGGRLRVTFDGRTSFLSGPAVIVAEGELNEAWLSGRPATLVRSPPAT